MQPDNFYNIWLLYGHWCDQENWRHMSSLKFTSNTHKYVDRIVKISEELRCTQMCEWIMSD